MNNTPLKTNCLFKFANQLKQMRKEEYDKKMKETFMIHALLLSIFTVVGFLLFMNGCDHTIEEKCLGYSYVKAKVLTYDVDAKFCCNNYENNVDKVNISKLSNLRCSITNQYVCYTSYVIMQYTNVGYNETCIIYVDNNNKNYYNALNDAKKKYKNNLFYNMYVKNKSNTCHSPTDLQAMADVGLAFLIIAILIFASLIFNIIYTTAKFMKSENLRHRPNAINSIDYIQIPPPPPF